MGFRVSWIARRGASTGELIDTSGRALTGERHDFPDVGFYLLELPDAADAPWVVLIADGSENFDKLDENHARALSDGGNETLFFWCSDTVMATELICFKDGTMRWAIRYSCEEEDMQPLIEGEVTEVAHEILARLRESGKADGGADYIYELTMDLGLQLVGFRHDMGTRTGETDPFQVLR